MDSPSSLIGQTHDWASGAGLPSGTPPAALTCLNRSNSIIEHKEESNNKPRESNFNKLNGYQKKAYRNFRYSFEEMVKTHGIENLVEITLTTREVLSREAYSAHFNSLNSNILKKKFPLGFIAVDEMQDRGAWHTHILAATGKDVKTGYVRKAGMRKKSANANLKALWDEWGSDYKTGKVGISERYGFGPAPHIEPIMTDAKKCGAYYAKYIIKEFLNRKAAKSKPSIWDIKKPKAHTRTIHYSKGVKKESPTNIEYKLRWEAKKVEFANKMGFPSVEKMGEQASLVLGSRWCYWLRAYIIQNDLDISWQQLLVEAKMEKDGNNRLDDPVQVGLCQNVVADRLSFRPIARTGVSNPSADNPSQELVKASLAALYRQSKLNFNYCFAN